MKPIISLTSTTVVIADDDIDTDQIIPARFLTTTSRDGLAQGLFANWRYLADGSPNPDFVLNQPAADGAQIIVAGNNVGCGSSREHAPWALLAEGFRAVLSSRIADIFRANSLKNGLLAIEVDESTHATLLSAPGARVTIDLAQCTISMDGSAAVNFEIEGFARHCLMEGVDQLGFILGQDETISRFEAQRT
ncbi:MAG: 3-isopropylmalate dehydratase small subunit [Pseudomonadota bacterium]